MNTRVVVLIFISLLIIIFILSGYYNQWQWTGLPATKEHGPKTLWDWLDLLIIPAVLGFGALWFKKAEASTERERAEEMAQLERDLENQRAQEAALEAYLDRMSNLLLDKGLRESEPGSPEQDLARTRTLTILRRLDFNRRNHVLRFLKDAQLLGKPKHAASKMRNTRETTIEPSGKNTIALLHGAVMMQMDLHYAELGEIDLSETYLWQANLSRAYMTGVDLCSANLTATDLREAILLDANLRQATLLDADLRKALLRSADLSKADLSRADLRDAILLEANLRQATLHDADLRGADLRGVRGVTCDQLRTATNWELSYRDASLACGVSIPQWSEEDFMKTMMSSIDESNNT